ncbi:BCCT family transporter [Corynebacterium sp. 335C]
MATQDTTRPDRTAPDPWDAPDDGPARINPKVAVPGLVVILGIAAWAIFGGESFSTAATTAFQWVVDNVGWFFIIMATVFFVAMVAIALSRYGSIKLGGDDEEPEFSTPSWIAMMFAAGMGIGLLFYGAYEPLYHYREGVPGHETHEFGTAFATTLLHWGPIAWATYAVVGVGIAYGTFRLGRPQLISAACTPLIGERRARGWIGAVIDVMAIVVTVFSTAMSLGLGSAQISAGMNAVGWTETSTVPVMLGIIGLLAIGYLASAMSGVARGVRIMSNANMAMAAALAIFILIAGPTVYILNTVPTATGAYVDQLFEMLSRTANSDDGTAGEWMGAWTVFYWVWWVAWTPFVGMFLARISRGRTIREFVIGIVAVPSLLTLLWFSIFGGAAIFYEQRGQSVWGDGTAEAMLFELLDRLPFSGVVSVLTMVLLATFFITTADSASTVMGTMSQYGRVNPTPWVTGVWGLMTTLIACVMLISGGTDVLDSLQPIIIAASSPFLIVVILLLGSLIKGVIEDPSQLDRREARKAYLRLLREQRNRARDGEPVPEKPAVIPDDGIPEA